MAERGRKAPENLPEGLNRGPHFVSRSQKGPTQKQPEGGQWSLVQKLGLEAPVKDLLPFTVTSKCWKGGVEAASEAAPAGLEEASR